MPQEIQYGSWPSPISADLVAAGGVGLGGVAVRRDGEGHGHIWWSELRPSEGGRAVIVRQALTGADSEISTPEDVLAAPLSARTRVHEYGGGAWFLGVNALYFSNWDDQRLYRLAIADDGSLADPEAITPEPEVTHGWRYADGRETPDGEWIVCVSEDHHPDVIEAHGEAVNSLVALPAGGGEPSVLTDRNDFVSNPRFSPDGRWLSWLGWDHPNMPWDGTRLLAAPVWRNTDELRIGNVQVVAGGDDVSITSADWASDGRLIFASDSSGFWNLQSWVPGTDDITEITHFVDREVGSPQWVFGQQQWVELSDNRIAMIVTNQASDELAVLESDGTLTAIHTPFVAWPSIAADGGSLVGIANAAAGLPAIVTIEASTAVAGVVREPADLGLSSDWFSIGEPIQYESSGRTAHAFFYPPTGPELSGVADERPPLVVMGHGGPTSHSSPDLSLKVQYWTSRGFAVVDVNYGGSTGFGREYRRLLNGAWGIVDVQDCIAAVESLAAAGRVDPTRMVIRGGSAGGFTVLSALEQSDAFAAGTSLYGVADLKALASDTHKFESRYLDNMIGPWPEAEKVYEERSPINHTELLTSPLLVLQGSEDEVVPPNQSEAIVAAVAAKGLAHAYILFEGEQHGFRQADTIVRSLEAELWFYGKVLGFEPADDIAPIPGAVGFESVGFESVGFD